jgi:hypothetical protein
MIPCVAACSGYGFFAINAGIVGGVDPGFDYGGDPGCQVKYKSVQNSD